jgi:hypothetical protein
VLIEKTRSVVTDGSGNYRIENLRPGTYSVTFTLTGFSTVKRNDVEVAGTSVTTADATLRVGTVAETVSSLTPTPRATSSRRTTTALPAATPAYSSRAVCRRPLPASAPRA